MTGLGKDGIESIHYDPDAFKHVFKAKVQDQPQQQAQANPNFPADPVTQVISPVSTSAPVRSYSSFDCD